MKSDKLLDTLLGNLESEFSGLKKDLDKFKFVVDITRVDPVTKAKLLSKKFVSEANNVYGDNFTGSKANNFLILKNKQQLTSVSNIIKGAADSDEPSSGADFTARSFGGAASQERTQDFILQQSSKARQKFSGRIVDKTASLMKYASPEFRLDFSDRVGKQLFKYNLTFNLPKDTDKRLQDRLLNRAVGDLNKGLKRVGEETVLGRAIERRADMIANALRTGKDFKSEEKGTITKKSKIKSKNKNKKSYFVPLQTSSGFFTNITSLIATINALLHDTIRDRYMESSGAASSPNYLRYQTGRFAKSAHVTSAVQNRTNIDIEFDYMVYPYETFRGGLHGPGRDPERIITGAIREIMIRQIHNKFNTTVRKS